MKLTQCGLTTAPEYPKGSLSLVLQPGQYQKSDLFHPPKHNTRSINQPPNRQTKKSINQSINQSTNQPTHQPTNQLINQSINQFLGSMS